MKHFLRRCVNNIRYAFYRKLREYGFKRMDETIMTNPKVWKRWAKITLYCLKKTVDIDIS